MTATVDTSDDFVPFQHFLDDLREQGRSANTLRAYQFDWQLFSRWYAEVNDEPISLQGLTALDVQDFVDWSKRQGFKSSTINRRLGLLKHFTRWAEEVNLVSSDLRRRVKRVSGPGKQTLAPKSLESTDVRKLLKELERTGTIRDQSAVLLMLYTGIRVGELIALQPRDVTIRSRSGSLTIRADVAKGSKERVVPLPLKAREALEIYLNERRKEMMSDDDLIFTGRQGPISAPGIAAMLKKYGRQSGIDGLTPHVLRHTFAFSYLANNGNDLVALADILGHSDLNTTQIYTKRRLSDLQDGVEQVKFY